MSRNVLILYLSPLACRNKTDLPKPKKEIAEFLYQIENTKKTVKGRQTNEATVRYLAIDKEEIPDKIIAICSEHVRSAVCKVEGYATTLDYFRDSVLVEAKYASSALEVIEVPNHMNDDARNDVIQTVATMLQPKDALYIDLSGGMRDTAMLFVTLARYLQTILDVTTHGVFYAELGGGEEKGYPNVLRDSTNLYDFLDMISAVDLFFESGNVTKLRKYLSSQNAGKSANLLLQKIEVFSNDLALCQMSAIKKDLQAIAQAIKTQDVVAEGNFHQLLFELFSQRFQQTLAPLIDSRTESFPQLIEWCNEHMLYQQALTLISEEMPAFVCKHILAQPTDKGFEYLQESKINNDKAWPYPLFHYHFCRLQGLNKAYAPSVNLCVNKAEAVQDSEQALYRLPTEQYFKEYLDEVASRGEMVFDTDAAAKAHLVQANDIYQRALVYRNRINHASKVADWLVCEYEGEGKSISQISAKVIGALLEEAASCAKAIQPRKRSVPDDVEVRDVNQKIQANLLQ